MPSLASLSMRGVGIVPPYTPKFPQPTLSTRMNTMLGFSVSALALAGCAVAKDVKPSAAKTDNAVRSYLNRLFCFMVFLWYFCLFRFFLLADNGMGHHVVRFIGSARSFYCFGGV
jgi:hypothetical protein